MKETVIVGILAKAHECLTLTQFLLEMRRFEFAVNRAYYTMYHSSQALLLLKDIRIRPSRKMHIAFNRELILTDELPQNLGGILKRAYQRSQ